MDSKKRPIALGIVGHGVVGHAVAAGFYGHYRLHRYDSDKSKTEFLTVAAMLAELQDGPAFVCVPTPMHPDGSCNLQHVHHACAQLDAHGRREEPRLVLLKSTVPPGTTDLLNAKYKNLRVIFNPEFLSARTADEEFLAQDRIILGGEPGDAMQQAHVLYEKAFPMVTQYITSAKIAEMVKMTTNAFFALKVAFANEIHQICDAMGIDAAKMLYIASRDARVGSTHWQVPGPDGKPGFGGACLPKDINSLIWEARKLGVDPRILLAAWGKNIEVRPGLDKELAVTCTAKLPVG